MNGIEKITARIEQDAQVEMDAMVNEAEAKAAEVMAVYREQVRAEEEVAGQLARTAAEQHYQRLESAADMEGRKMRLAAKQKCIEDAFAKAQASLLSLPEEEYVELLAKMAVRAAATGREEIILNRRDRDSVGMKVVSRANDLLTQAAAPELPEELKGVAGGFLGKVTAKASALLQGTAMLHLSDEVRDMAGGVILRDDKVEVNCTFETQLRVLRERMAADVARVLFP